MRKLDFSESFLHYIWQNQLYSFNDIYTIEGESIEVVRPGILNHDAGPDFSNAKIKIGDKIWVGNVEIHKNSTDWFHHNHHLDKAYNNVILHVVYQCDIKDKSERKNFLPTLELSNRISPSLVDNYANLANSLDEIPCINQLQKVKSIYITNMLYKVGVLRIQNKTEELKELFAFTNNSFEETLYLILAKAFGGKLNGDAFVRLCKSIPKKQLMKFGNDSFKLEALLFGFAGLIPEHHIEDYPVALQKEYVFQSKKIKLNRSANILWKFSRMRPSSFPTIRISQFCNLLVSNTSLSNEIFAAQSVHELKSFLKCTASSFWETHYTFSNESKKLVKTLGDQSMNTIIINAIVPFLFFYGQQENYPEQKEKALKFLEQLEAEKNRVTRKWNNWGVPFHSAFETQAVLSLEKNYCSKKKCTSCYIGHQILSSK